MPKSRRYSAITKQDELYPVWDRRARCCVYWCVSRSVQVDLAAALNKEEDFLRAVARKQKEGDL